MRYTQEAIVDMYESYIEAEQLTMLDTTRSINPFVDFTCMIRALDILRILADEASDIIGDE